MIVLYTVLAIILVLLVVLLLNVAVCTRKARALEGQHPTFTDAELESYGKTFSRMLQCATVSVKDSYDDTEFAKLRQVVEAVNEAYREFDEAKLAAVRDMIAQNVAMQAWSVENLYVQQAA